jgi:hypothetical protein
MAPHKILTGVHGVKRHKKIKPVYPEGKKENAIFLRLF